MSRSNKEGRDVDQLPTGSGLLDRAKKALQGRRRNIDEAVDAASEGTKPSKPKKKKTTGSY
jgi:hypothetical protein